ncbi:MAG: hypothetical protein AAFV28_15320, partial [Cyanobacteria bacterium J06635_13]
EIGNLTFKLIKILQTDILGVNRVYLSDKRKNVEQNEYYHWLLLASNELTKITILGNAIS